MFGAPSEFAQLFPDFEEVANAPAPAVGRRVLVIAMTPRTGSTNLVHALQRTGLFGVPTELFNPRGPAQVFKERVGARSFRQYLAALAFGPVPCPVFKVSWQDFRPVESRFRRLFADPFFLILDRRDIVAQGVSLYRAQASGQWHAAADDAWRPEPPYDAARIDAAIEGLRREKAGWRGYFADEKIDPPRLDYEDFEDDVGVGVGFVCAALGMAPPPVPPAADGFRRLADAGSAAWVARLRARQGEAQEVLR